MVAYGKCQCGLTPEAQKTAELATLARVDPTKYPSIDYKISQNSASTKRRTTYGRKGHTTKWSPTPFLRH